VGREVDKQNILAACMNLYKHVTGLLTE